jgi:hypothetical protein
LDIPKEVRKTLLELKLNAIWAHKQSDFFGYSLPTELADIPERNFLPYLSSKNGFTINQLNDIMDTIQITEQDLKKYGFLKSELLSRSNRESNNFVRKVFGLPEKI